MSTRVSPTRWPPWICGFGVKTDSCFCFRWKVQRYDSSQVAMLIHPNCHDKGEFISKSHTSQKFTLCPPPESCKSVAAPQTDKPQWAEDVTSRCVLGDLRRIPHCVDHLGPLEFSGTHTVFINVRSHSCKICVFKSWFLPNTSAGSMMISVLPQAQTFNREGGIVPQPGRDIWMRNFVKMPCSPSNIIYKDSSSKVCNRRHIHKLKSLSDASVNPWENIITFDFNDNRAGGVWSPSISIDWWRKKQWMPGMWRYVRRDFHSVMAAQKKEMFNLFPLFSENHYEIQPEVQRSVVLRRPDSICWGACLLDSKQIINSWEWLKTSNGRSDSFQCGVNEEINVSELLQKIAALALKLPTYVMKVHKPAGSTRS